MKYSARILASVLVATAFVAAGVVYTPASAEPNIALASDLRVRPLQSGLWLVESDTDWNGSTISANGLVLVSDTEVLVVDTPWTDRQTGRLLDWIEREIGRPVLAYVVTHAHDDRIGGIAELHRRGIPTYGFEGTVELAMDQEFEVPENTFSESLDLTVGRETVSLVYPGPGHALDNIVVWFEDRQLLYGGCFIKNLGSKGLGYTGDADLDQWSESLARMEGLLPEPSQVIPGHGAPGNSELIAHTAHLLDQAPETSPK